MAHPHSPMENPAQPAAPTAPGYAPPAPGYAPPAVPAPGYAPPAAAQPAPEPTSVYAGFSVAAIGVLIGAVLSIASYPMVWYYVTADPDASVTGLMQTHSGSAYDVTYHSSRLHWAVGVAAVVLIGLAVMRLLGKYHSGLVRVTITVSVLGVAGGLFSALVVSDGFSAGNGAYLALAGSLIACASALAMALAKK